MFFMSDGLNLAVQNACALCAIVTIRDQMYERVPLKVVSFPFTLVRVCAWVPVPEWMVLLIAIHIESIDFVFSPSVLTRQTLDMKSFQI